MYRLQQAAREHREPGLEEGEDVTAPPANGAQADRPSVDEDGTLKSLSLPLLPKLPICNREVLSTYEDAAGGSLPRHSVDGRAQLVSLRSGASIQPPGSATGAAAENEPGVVSPMKDARAIWGLLMSSYMNVLLLAAPLGFAAHFLGWSALWRFGLNFLALVPLALLLGEVTEDLALRFGDVIGGLLNATFGNVVELILSLAALQKGLYDVVAMSLVGSVLSNLLLVLGCCFLVGGTQYHQQRFNAGTNKAMCSLLFLACIALALPTASRHLYTTREFSTSDLLHISHGTAALLVITYGAYLYFQLGTHRDEGSPSPSGGGEAESSDDDDASGEVPSLSLAGAVSMLTAITVIVAFNSEFLTASIEEVSDRSGIGRPFLGLIVLPIAGNACEHITAVFVAAKDKMDLAIGVALGSSIQIAIFVLPTVVLAGWATGKTFTLDLDPLSAVILTLSVIHANFVSSDGSSNWLLGLQLVGTYVLISLLYFFRSS
jgi:Ca2+:H+ antiporter